MLGFDCLLYWFGLFWILWIWFWMFVGFRFVNSRLGLVVYDVITMGLLDDFVFGLFVGLWVLSGWFETVLSDSWILFICSVVCLVWFLMFGLGFIYCAILMLICFCFVVCWRDCVSVDFWFCVVCSIYVY